MSDEQYVIQRRITQHKLKRKARRVEILIRRLFKIIKFCLILALFYSVYKVANSHYWYLTSDTFENGKNIEILGNDIVSNDKILKEIQKIQIEKQPIYKINPDKIVKGLETLPPIKRAYVRRFWYPARLVVMVQEVIPAIVIMPSENVAEVAAYSFDGEFINRDYLPLAKKNYAIKVLSYGTKDDDYEKWDEKRINTLYKLVREIEYYSGEKAKYLDLRIPNNAFIQLKSVKIRLGVIDLEVFERIKELNSMMKSPDVKRLSSNTKYIDLSWSKVQYINVTE